MLMVHFDSYFKCSSINLILFHMGGGGGAGSTYLQIVFIVSVRDAAEPHKVVTFQKFIDKKILNMETRKFQPESCAMAIFGKRFQAKGYN